MSVKNGTVKKIFHAAIIVVISVAMSLLFSACAPKGDGEEHTHEYVNYTYNNDATCVADGTETGKCKYCDKTDTRTKANTATGVHTYNSENICIVCGHDAFYNCRRLSNINIPNSVTSIGEYAFERCTALTSINIPDSVTSIGARAFRDCSNLTSITIPNSVTSIGDYAFA